MAKRFDVEPATTAAELLLNREQTKEPEKGATIEELSELRTKRVQLLMQPSLHAKAKTRAHQLEISFNEYISRLVEQDLYGED